MLGVSVAALAIVVWASCSERDGPRSGPGVEGAEEFVPPDLEPFTGDLPEMRQRHLIRALVAPSRTDFFVDSGRIRGIQAELLKHFAAQLNARTPRATDQIRIQYVPVAFDELIPALRAGRGDVAAAFLTVTPERSEEIRFGAPFRRAVSEVVVTHRGGQAPGSVEALSGRDVYVLRGSSYAEHLRALDARLRAGGRPGLELEEADPHLRSEDILELVNAGVVETTVVDDYKAELWARVLPDVVVHEDLAVSGGNQVAWAVRAGSPMLKAAIDRFARKAREGALFGNVLLRALLREREVDHGPDRERRTGQAPALSRALPRSTATASASILSRWPPRPIRSPASIRTGAAQRARSD